MNSVERLQVRSGDPNYTVDQLPHPDTLALARAATAKNKLAEGGKHLRETIPADQDNKNP